MQGVVTGFTWSDAFRTISWAEVVFAGTTATYVFYTWDGFYDGYLFAGNYDLRVVEWTPHNEGHGALQSTVAVSQGQFVTGLNFYLERSGTPIPELTLAQVLGSLGLLSIAVILTKRRTRGAKRT